MTVHLDIVLPCYNPNETWFSELLDFNAQAKSLYNIRYIIVNDGSTTINLNNSIKTLKALCINVYFISYSANKGKGHALRQGVKISDAPFTIYTDVDFPFTNASTLAVLSALVEGNADVVAGYRDDSYYAKNMAPFRKALSKAFRFFIKKVLRMPVSDTQCGLKGFNNRGKVAFLNTRTNRYLFDFEFIFKSSNDPAIKIRTVPVFLKENVTFSKMKVKILLQEFFNLLYILLSGKNNQR